MMVESKTGPVRVPDSIRIEKHGEGPARMWIDGVLFEYGTVSGFTVNPRRGEMPAVTLSIVAMRIELVDDTQRKPADDRAP